MSIARSTFVRDYLNLLLAKSFRYGKLCSMGPRGVLGVERNTVCGERHQQEWEESEWEESKWQESAWEESKWGKSKWGKSKWGESKWGQS